MNINKQSVKSLGNVYIGAAKKAFFVFSVLILLIGVFSTFLTALYPNKAKATANATSFSWINHNEIRDNGGDRWIDPDSGDKKFIFYLQKDNDTGCRSSDYIDVIFGELTGSSSDLGRRYDFPGLDQESNLDEWLSPESRKQATVFKVTPDPNNGGCTNEIPATESETKAVDWYKAGRTINLGNDPLYSFVYTWIDRENITRLAFRGNQEGNVLIGSNTYTYDKDYEGGSFKENGGQGKCADFIKPDSSKKYVDITAKSNVRDDGQAMGYAFENSPNLAWEKANIADFTCWKTKTVRMQVSGTAEFSNKEPGKGDTSTPGDTTPGTAAAEDTCNNSVPILGWMVCAFAAMADGLTSTIEDVLKSLLTINKSDYGEGSGVNELKTSWAAIRIIATALLVIIALVMVLSQIFSVGVTDAYTVKKILPRLVIATILIQLSWVLFTGLLLVINTIGDGIGELLAAPFGGMDAISFTSIVNNLEAQTSITAGAFVTGVGLVAFGATGGAAALIGLAIVVLFAIFTAIATLVLRKIVLIVLLVISPLALIAWILPNTQNVWKLWWNTFIKLALMYPLIIALLTAGKIFATLASQATTPGSASSNINALVALIAFFGPFFLIPATFKFAGGLFAQAATGINKVNSGIGNKVGASAKTGTQKYAAKKYRPGDRSFRARLGNAAARTTTGDIRPGRKSQFRTAGIGANARKEETNQANFMLQEALRLIPEENDKNEYLQGQLTGRNSSARDAAFKQLIARANGNADDPGFAIINNASQQRGRGPEWLARMGESAYADGDFMRNPAAGAPVEAYRNGHIFPHVPQPPNNQNPPMPPPGNPPNPPMPPPGNRQNLPPNAAGGGVPGIDF